MFRFRDEFPTSVKKKSLGVTLRSMIQSQVLLEYLLDINCDRWIYSTSLAILGSVFTAKSPEYVPEKWAFHGVEKFRLTFLVQTLTFSELYCKKDK